MPDISMCKGDECPIKESCYRFTAKPSEYTQSWFVDVPYSKVMERCDYHWNVNTAKKYFKEPDNGG